MFKNIGNVVPVVNDSSIEQDDKFEKSQFLHKLFDGMFENDSKEIDKIIQEGKQSKIFSDSELDEYAERVKEYLPIHRRWNDGPGSSDKFDTETNVAIAKMKLFQKSSLEKFQ